MRRRRFLCGLGLMGWSSWLSAGHATTPQTAQQTDELVTRRRTGRALGTTVCLTVRHDTHEQADQALTQGFAELERVEELLSIYRPTSQLSQLNERGFLSDPHPDFLRILGTARDISVQSEGAFDVTIQPLWQLYADAAKSGQLPAAALLQSRLRQVAWQRVVTSADRIELQGDQTRITLNGIAQGFVADCVLKLLRSEGVRHALVDTGELAGQGTNEQQRAWRVGIQHPRRPESWVAITHLDGRCLATSGDYETHFSADFTAHHILDPRSGRSPSELASVSVLAPSAVEADGLSTAVFVLGVARGLELLSHFPSVDGLLIDKDGRARATAGFPIVPS